MTGFLLLEKEDAESNGRLSLNATVSLTLKGGLHQGLLGSVIFRNQVDVVQATEGLHEFLFNEVVGKACHIQRGLSFRRHGQGHYQRAVSARE